MKIYLRNNKKSHSNKNGFFSLSCSITPSPPRNSPAEGVIQVGKVQKEIVKTDNKELNDFIFSSNVMQKMKW